MRWIFGMLAAGVMAIAQGVTVEMRHTHGVFYPEVKQQGILQLKITGEPGEKITRLDFSDSKTTQTTDIQMARLSTSGSWNGYTLNTNKLVQEKPNQIKKENFPLISTSPSARSRYITG